MNNNNNFKTTGLKRITIDKYYTKTNIVKECMDFVRKYITIDTDDLCIEPSAGNGSFITQIKSLFNNYKFYDLEPENSEIIRLNYLELDSENLKKYQRIHVIGNPPFGRQSSLAIQFIKKSVEFCDTISFILPKSFKKSSMKKHFPLLFHLEYEYELPKFSFTVENKNYDVPCVFQIWIKKDVYRCVPNKLVENKYRFVKKDESYDISFRRVGVYAGKIDRNGEDKSPQSHYFIKFEIPFTDDLFEKLSNIDYNTKNDTVGPKSISKQELIKEFNSIIN
jgi:predicted RNA methylase